MSFSCLCQSYKNYVTTNAECLIPGKNIEHETSNALARTHTQHACNGISEISSVIFICSILWSHFVCNKNDTRRNKNRRTAREKKSLPLPMKQNRISFFFEFYFRRMLGIKMHYMFCCRMSNKMKSRLWAFLCRS